MRITLMLGALALIALTAFVTSRAVSQESPKAPSPEEMAEIMKRTIEAGTPGPHHARLARWVGGWDVAVMMWMGGPETTPLVGKGRAEFESILGGRFVIQRYTGMFPGMGPYEGLGISGYDNYRKRYTDLWMDSVNTGVFTLHGHLDPTGKVLTMMGEMDEPGTGEVGKIARFVTTEESGDRFVMEAFDLALGPDAKVMEMTYTRRRE